MALVETYIDPDAGGAGTGADWTNAYLSMSLWDAGEQTDLPSDGNYHIAHARSSSGSADATSMNIAGWDTAIANYIEVLGDHQSSTYDATKYHRTADIQIYESFVRLRRIGFNMTATAIDRQDTQAISDGDIHIEGCFFKGDSSAGDYAIWQVLEGTTIIRIWNCIFDDYDRAINADQDPSQTMTYIFYNNTIYNALYGIMLRDSAITQYCKNNIIHATNAFYGTWTDNDANNDYNSISENTNHDAIGSHGRYNQTFTFTDAGNDNFALGSADAGAKGFGVDLRADAQVNVTDDANGTARTATFDIGAYGFPAAVGADDNATFFGMNF